MSGPIMTFLNDTTTSFKGKKSQFDLEDTTETLIEEGGIKGHGNHEIP